MAISNPTVLATASAGGTDAFVEATGITGFVANSLLVVCAETFQASSGETVSSVTDDIGDTGGGSWSWDEYQGTSGLAYSVIAWRKLGTSPGSNKFVRVTWSNAGRTKAITVHQLQSGYNTTTPRKQGKHNSQSGGGSISLTLDTTPDSDSLVMGMAIGRRCDGDVAFGSGYTELSDHGTGTGPNDGWIQTQYKNGSATTTYDVSGFGTQSNSLAIAAIEIDAAAAAAFPEELYPKVNTLLRM